MQNEEIDEILLEIPIIINENHFRQKFKTNSGKCQSVSTNSERERFEADQNESLENNLKTLLENNLKTSCSLLQFPLGLANLPFQGRMKSGKIQLDLSLHDMPTETLDHNDGMDVDGDYNSKPMEIMTLDSFKVPSNASYMVGKVHGKALYLTPIDVYQLRPSLHFIDKLAEKEKSFKLKATFEDQKDLNPNFEEEARAIQVTVRSVDDKEGSKKALLAEMQRAMDKEPWKPLDIHHPNSELSKSFLNTMHSSKKEKVTCLKQRGVEYLETISTLPPPLVASASTSPLTPSQLFTPSSFLPSSSLEMSKSRMLSLPFTQTTHMPLTDRILTLLLSAHVIQFTTILNLINSTRGGGGPNVQVQVPLPGRGEETLISILKQVAWCISGRWIVKSGYLYKSRALDARDYLLGLLASKGVVHRGDWATQTHLDTHVSENMISEICHLDRERGGWVLKIEADEGFVEGHGDLIQQQKEEIMALSANALEYMTTIQTKRKGTAISIKSEPSTLLAPTSSTPLGGGTFENEKFKASEEMLVYYEVMGETAQDQAQNMIKTIFLANGCLSRPQIHQIFNYQATRSSTLSNGGTEVSLGQIQPSTLDSILGVLATEIRPDILAISSTGTSSLDMYRVHVIEMFMKQDKIKKAEIVGRWNENGVIEGKKVSNAIYTKVMNEFATTKAAGVWILKWI